MKNVDELIAKLAEEHSKALQKSTQQYQDMLEQHNAVITERLAELDKRVALMQEEGRLPAEDAKPTPQPAAMWMEVEGERVLVLNELAAQKQVDLMDGLEDLFKELQEALPQ